MGTAVLGTFGIQLESTTSPGEVLVLSASAVGTLSLTTALSAIAGATSYVGWRLHIYVKGNSATGTVTITGKDFSQAQNALAETTPTINIAGSGNNVVSTGFEYCTAGIFSAVNASGVTVSGLTGGTITIYAVQAVRSLQPVMFDAEEKIPQFSPQEQRGLRTKHTNIQRMNKVVDIGSFKQPFYPDTCAWWFGRTVIGSSPTQATIPASPAVLKASATPTGSVSLTTQPNAAAGLAARAALLQFVVSGGTTAVGTIAVTGTNVDGIAITETVQAGKPGAATGDGTYYTQQAFATVGASGVTYTGLTGGTPLCVINGIIGTQETYTRSTSGAGDTYQSLAAEWYTGTDAIAYPYFFVTETTIEGSVEKENLITLKAGAQNSLNIGDRTTTPMTARARASQIGAVGAFAGSSSINPAAGLWQPFDVNIPGWQTQWFIDAMSGTPGTTGYNQVLSWKVIFKTPQKPSFPAVNLQWFQKLYAEQDETQIDLVIDFVDLVQYETFRQNVKQILYWQLIGPAIGSPGAVAYNKNWAFTFLGRIIAFKRDPSKMEKVEATVSFLCEHDVTLGYEFKLITQTQIVPNYAG